MLLGAQHIKTGADPLLSNKKKKLKIPDETENTSYE
jgi:hypothetical protein